MVSIEKKNSLWNVTTSKDIWTLKLHDTIMALQAIWNKIYKGSVQDWWKKIKHLVEKGNAVYDVVCQILMLLLTISTNYSQSTPPSKSQIGVARSAPMDSL